MQVSSFREMGPHFGDRTAAIGAKRLWGGVMICLVVALFVLAMGSPSAQAQDLGYRVQSGDGAGGSLALAQSLAHRDFAYGNTLNSAPTGAMPESKLWWNDGSWWGSLYSPAAQAFHVYRLDNASHTWLDTGTALDNRAGSRADVLWDGVNQKLYVVSHLFNSVGQTASSPSEWGRLYRLSYSAGAGSYILDPGFPVNVTRGVEAALTIAKDSRGVLWVTYVENGQVMINHSTTSDLNWGTPLALSAGAAAGRLSSGDLSAAISFQGDKLGVMWSNQANGTFSFAVHNDGDADTAWQSVEMALGGSNSACSGACARPSIDIKTDGTGRVFAAVATAVTSPSDARRTMLLVRDMTGGWTNYVFGTAGENHGNPMLLLDEEAGRLSMFAASPAIGGAIYQKTSDLNNIQFTAGLGSALIQSSTDMAINNATSTKQNISGATGMVVQASDSTTHYYLSATILPAIAPAITSFTPTSGPTATSVSISGSGFTGATSVTFNGTAATFTVSSDSLIAATVPGAASTGPIRVTTAGGIATSLTNFTVTPKLFSFSPTSGTLGTAVIISGTGFTGATSVTFHGTLAFFTVNSSTKITTSVPGGATTGKLTVTGGGVTVYSTGMFTVTSAAAPTISSFTPTSGPTATVVTITGTNFTGATGVAFNGVAATFKGISDTQISATVPGTASTGPITVTNSAGSVTSASKFTVTPKIISFTPTSGVLGTAVTITGTGFTGVTSMAFDHLSTTSFIVVNSNTITTTVPSGADSGKLNVTGGGVTVYSNGSFTVNSSALPTISSFTPASGPTGTVITINGTNFTGITGITVNGTAVGLYPNFTPISDTQCKATVPGAASTGPIKVTNTLGSASSTTNFTVTPKITSFTPTTGGAMGAAVTITGSGFTGVTSVVFDHLAQPTFTVLNSNTITTTVPGGAISGKLNVTGSGVTVYSNASFTVNSSAGPTITSFSPASGPTGTVVTVTGSHFTGLTGVTFNGTQAGLLYPAFKAVSDTQFTIAVPGAASTGPLKLTNTMGSATTPTNYTVTPKITSFSPSSGAVGAVVTITGSGFTGATSVTFHGTAATFTVVNSNTISATVPTGATTGKLTVTGNGVTVFSNLLFTVL